MALGNAFGVGAIERGRDVILRILLNQAPRWLAQREPKLIN